MKRYLLDSIKGKSFKKMLSKIEYITFMICQIQIKTHQNLVKLVSLKFKN